MPFTARIRHECALGDIARTYEIVIEDETPKNPEQLEAIATTLIDILAVRANKDFPTDDDEEDDDDDDPVLTDPPAITPGATA